MNRWVEHNTELYSRENKCHQSALDAIESLPEIPELDTIPSPDELAKAIDKLPRTKAIAVTATTIVAFHC